LITGCEEVGLEAEIVGVEACAEFEVEASVEGEVGVGAEVIFEFKGTVEIRGDNLDALAGLIRF
jgi:hypothetical protein